MLGSLRVKNHFLLLSCCNNSRRNGGSFVVGQSVALLGVPLRMVAPRDCAAMLCS